MGLVRVRNSRRKSVPSSQLHQISKFTVTPKPPARLAIVGKRIRSPQAVLSHRTPENWGEESEQIWIQNRGKVGCFRMFFDPPDSRVGRARTQGGLPRPNIFGRGPENNGVDYNILKNLIQKQWSKPTKNTCGNGTPSRK